MLHHRIESSEIRSAAVHSIQPLKTLALVAEKGPTLNSRAHQTSLRWTRPLPGARHFLSVTCAVCVGLYVSLFTHVCICTAHIGVYRCTMYNRLDNATMCGHAFGGDLTCQRNTLVVASPRQIVFSALPCTGCSPKPSLPKLLPPMRKKVSPDESATTA